MVIDSMSQRLYMKHKEGSGLTGGEGVEKFESLVISASSKFIFLFGKLCIIVYNNVKKKQNTNKQE